ncbi:MAG TPA: hypothetical protein VFA65_15850 [Bryobacteraceae bacterium]|nr:hypothetical protein [Bryobacteraceae bacterium]
MAVHTYHAKGSGYYPSPTKMEGGSTDRMGKKLNTLQSFLAGQATYVSVAMDKISEIPYGTVVKIPEIEKANRQKAIEFRVVDTGDSFKGQGFKRIDICVADRQASLDPTINGTLTLIFDY